MGMLLDVAFVGLPLASATKGSYLGTNGKVVFCAYTTNPKTAIFVMNEDGSDKQQLTSGDFYDDYPCWSPDGNRIVFGRSEFSIWIMNSDGSGALDLTPSMPDARSPDYQTLPSIIVGGYIIEPTPKREILAPYLAFLGLVIIASIVVLIKNRGKY